MVSKTSHKIEGVETLGQHLVKKYQGICKPPFQAVVYQLEIVTVVQDIEVLDY